MTDVPPSEPLVRLPGSARPPVEALRRRALPPDAPVDFTLVLRRRRALDDETVAAGRLDRVELAERYGADRADVDLVVRTLTAAGAEVVQTDAASRRVRAVARPPVVERLFRPGLELALVAGPAGPVEQRTRSGDLSVPAAWAGVVTAVLGLDTRPQARARVRAVPAAQVETSYTPPQLAKVYGMPDGTDGSGQVIAIVELGGGFAQSDVDTYFRGLGFPAPTVTAVGVDGAANVPGQDPTGADGEVLLDIEVAGGVAPRATVIVYFAPNTDAGFVAAISTAAHADPAPTAMSISWGQSEDGWTGQGRTAMDDALADAAALGVTVTVAAGDDGSSDRASDRAVHVDFPASSPHALGCGGTTLQANPTTGSVSRETVWNNGTGQGATGGGVSDVFALPAWQQTAGVPDRAGAGTGRGVPDVAAVADPRTGYEVYVDGRAQVIGGTSAVAPLWAGLACRLAQALGARLGLLAPRLYTGAAAGHPAAGLRDITSGDNGAYRAGPGWDACTGLGVPAAGLLAQLRAHAGSAA